LKRFQGWVPETTTHYDYNGDGTIAYSWVEQEPEWDHEQQELMVSLMDYENSLHTCGHPIGESTSPLADPDNPNREYFYATHEPIRCYACTSNDRGRNAYEGYDSARIFVTEKVMMKR
jgi:hypothetical protein